MDFREGDDIRNQVKQVNNALGAGMDRNRCPASPESALDPIGDASYKRREGHF